MCTRALSKIVRIGICCFPLIATIGCSTSPDRKAEEERERLLAADLCLEQSSGEFYVVQTVNNQGGVIAGDVTQVFRGQQSAAALAVTKRDDISVRRAGYGYCCTQNVGYFWCGYQYCVGAESLSLRSAFGFARAPDIEEARDLALENCEEAADRLAEFYDARKSSSAFDCRVVRSTYCRF